MTTALVAAGFETDFLASSAAPEVDGYTGTRYGLPYHVHPEATPAEWTLLAAAIKSGEVVPTAYSGPSAAEVKVALCAYAGAKARELLAEAVSFTADNVTILSNATASTLADWSALIQWAASNPSGTAQWIADDGSVTPLPAEAVAGLARLVGDRSQAIYTTQATVLSAIAAETIAETAQIDAAAWPK